MSGVKSNCFISAAVHALRKHRYCGDAYPEEGWPEINAALAEYAKHKRMRKRLEYFRRHRRRG